MECLVSQQAINANLPVIGDTGITLDIGQEIKSFIQANPIPSIGLALAGGYLLYTLFK